MTERFADRFADLIPSLRSRYDAPGRAYHNWSHIHALLALYDDVSADLNDPTAVEIALYYHDVVYVAGSKTNEAESADVMVQELESRVEKDQISSAAVIIYATAVHAVPPGTDAPLARDCALFLDMDLAILGASAEAFDACDQHIRQEFAMIPDSLFYPGRRKVMQGFLERERIYLTDRFHASHDAMARENLQRLVERLP